MKFLLVAVACLAVFAAAEADLYAEFIDWTVANGKEYANAYEHSRRFQNYKDNAALVKHLNRQGKGTFELNKFADLSLEEFSELYLRPFPSSDVQRNGRTLPYNPFRAYPEAKDWVKDGAVPRIKNQASCGSCWAFSAVTNMESIYKIVKGGDIPDLSEQNLVDCEHDCMIFPGTTSKVCDQGCNGGLMPNAFTYVIREGLATEQDYPYTAKTEKCKAEIKHEFFVDDWSWVGANETAMVAALNDIGPLAIAVDATYWSFYKGGIYDSSCSSTRLNHAVALVGYGSENGVDYWIIRNSWDTTWGEQGYMRLIRGKNKCGINNFVCTVLYK